MKKKFKPCSVKDCDRSSDAAAHGHNGMCSAHYQRVRIHGDPHVLKIGKNATVKKPTQPFKECGVEGCDRDARRSANGKRGYCSMPLLQSQEAR